MKRPSLAGALGTFRLALLLAAPLSLLPARAQALELPELAALAKPSVVLLKISDRARDKAGLGTGFFVSRDGRIVTNHHVIDGATRVVAALADGRTVDVVGILADDEARDIAVLQAAPGDYTPLTLGDSHALRPGDEIAIVGSPLGLSGSLSAGIVSAIRESGPSPFDEKKDDTVASWGIQVTAAISPGSSGSPIMTRKGDVVAVAVGRLGGGEALNFGIPIEIAKSMTDGIAPGVAAKSFTRTGQTSLLRNLGISAAVFTAPYLAYVVWRRRSARPKVRRV